ncbi:peptidyl-prolyl cis-trans isomerase D [Daejeonella lutea]|uniref:Periplasmic chaperone PpiD n=2 Tax=Daejeonella lutea TaxID=572036 RepID=A0A1T5D3H4_9SPHI|nr:peptidyl-prolyl cis-trans isomerase D [Daejeonella lutea]
MGIMSFLRNRAGIIIVGAIGFAIVAFLVSDAVQMGGSLMNSNQTEVGEVDGEAISVLKFNEQVELNTNNFKQQMGQSNLDPQMTSYIIENTWNQQVSKILMDKEINRLGLQVSKNELNDLITGKNPDPQILQNFGDPQTGQLNRVQLNSFLDNIKTQDAKSPVSIQWTSFLLNIRENKLAQKYNNLVKNSLYVTSLEAKEDYNQRNRLANFKYVNLEYASIPDNQAKITDQDYKDYYNENKYRFKNLQETRTFEYVVFDANPTKTDTADTKAIVDKTAADFRAATNDSLFVSINSETKMPVSYVRKGQLEAALDSAVFASSNGAFIGPIFSNGQYKMVKVLNIKSSPDSVKASHILINPATEGGVDKAKAKADSIAGLIAKGASFSELATKFGTDASKDKGGDLGTFARGAMIPAFEEVVFNGKTGDVKVVTTQFGVHVIKITGQVGSSRVAKIAMVDKSLASSSKTQQLAYSKATSFLSTAKDGESFDASAQKSGYSKLIAENVVATQSSIPGLDNPREMIRWAFGADKGDVSEQVFEMGNKFAVAKVVDVFEKGTLPLEQVKKQIETAVRNKVKARMLTEKLTAARNGASSIEQVAQKAGRPVTPVQNIVFANPVIPGIAQENKLVGTIFGSQPGKLSEVIEGDNGIYVFVVNGFSSPAPLTNVFKQKVQVSQALVQRAPGEAFKVLRDKADIKDNRVKFF